MQNEQRNKKRKGEDYFFVVNKTSKESTTGLHSSDTQNRVIPSRDMPVSPEFSTH
jgi:hypothetical protein